MPTVRCFPFDGDDAAYIHFLERRVFELENLLCCPPHHRSCAQNEKSPLTDRSSRADRPLVDREPTRSPYRRECSDQVTTHSRDLQVIEFHPNHPPIPPRKRTCRRGTKLRWQSSLDNFLSKIPLLSKWGSGGQSPLEKRKISALVRGHAFPDEASEDPLQSVPTEQDVLPILAKFGEFTTSTKPDGEFCRRLARFRELIFVSFCAVVLKTDINAAEVYEIMRNYSGSKAEDKHLQKLISGAKWANRTIFALSKTRWGSQSWEVFFVGKFTSMTPNFYYCG